MKRTAILSLALFVFSCKKQANPVTGNSNDIQATVLSLTSSESLAAFSPEQKKALIDYLDRAPDADRQQIDDKLRSLSTEKDMATSSGSQNSKTTTGTMTP
jgi:hypothetical protein